MHKTKEGVKPSKLKSAKAFVMKVTLAVMVGLAFASVSTNAHAGAIDSTTMTTITDAITGAGADITAIGGAVLVLMVTIFGIRKVYNAIKKS